MKHNAVIILAILFVVIGASRTFAQAPQTQMPEAQQQGPTDPIQQLNLTPEQREKIRSIREQTRSERASLNQRIRETNMALEAALDADNPDEALIEQRVRDAAAAQAASMRMRILTEVRIRRVLTLEQLELLRALRQQARATRRNRMLDNAEQRRQDPENSRPLRNQRNGGGQLFPRRDLQRRPRP